MRYHLGKCGTYHTAANPVENDSAEQHRRLVVTVDRCGGDFRPEY
jgi:hypothetical protein